jgi:CheY-like chemotaxis protein
LVTQSKSSLQALLIDDSRLDRQLICRLVKSTGLSVDLTEVEDAFAALDMLRDVTFDCILVDQRMPGIIGTEFIRALRSMESETRTPILMLTSEGAPFLTAEEALDAGGDLFVAKNDLTVDNVTAALLSLMS